MSLSSPLNHASRFMLKLGVLMSVALPMSAFAAEVDNPKRSNIDMMEGVTTHSTQIYDMYSISLIVCCVIAVLVFGAMFFAIIFHRKSRGVTPAKFEHSTAVEIVWTIAPFFVLVWMAVPAAKLVMELEDKPGPKENPVEIQVTAHQWMWSYEYIGDKGSKYYSRLAADSNAGRGLNSGVDVTKIPNYLLNVDKPLKVPVSRKIILKINSTDVIHAWWVPDLAVKKDAVPGYTNVVWFEATKEGVYRGVCAELCGADHGFMPIVVEVVSQAEYELWVDERQKENADRREALKKSTASIPTKTIIATNDAASMEGAL